MRHYTRYLLIGDGRLASHFGRYFKLLGLNFETWSRKQNSIADLNQKIQNAERILLLISDNAIDEFADKYLKKYLNNPSLGKLVIHCSGAHVFESIIGAHPLQSFAKDQSYTLDQYQQICFFYERNKQGLEFSDIFPDLENPNFAINSEQKPFYHALCVGANNFTTILWQVFAKRMQKEFNVPFDKLKYYAETTLNNIQNDITNALTGPLIRDDEKTISKNLDSLDDDNFKLIYKAFCKFYKSEINDNKGNKNEN